jgi:hypothetical protein
MMMMMMMMMLITIIIIIQLLYFSVCQERVTCNIQVLNINAIEARLRLKLKRKLELGSNLITANKTMQVEQ